MTNNKTLFNTKFSLLVSILLVLSQNIATAQNNLPHADFFSTSNFLSTSKSSDSKNKTTGSFVFSIETEFMNASRILAPNGKVFLTDTIIRIDTTRTDTDENDTIKRGFTTILKQQKYSLKAGYVHNNLNLFVGLPFVSYNIEEKTTRDNDNTPREVIRNTSSPFYAEGLDFFVNYNILNNNFLKIGILGNLFVPFYPYEKTNVSDDSLNVIYAPNFVQSKKIEQKRTFETIFGTEFAFNLKPVTLEIRGVYNYRNWNEHFSDRLIFDLFVGLESVADAQLFANFKYITSLGDMDERYCDYWTTTLWERAFDLDIGFKMFFTEELYIQAGYSIRLWGENTLAQNVLKFNLGYFVK